MNAYVDASAIVKLLLQESDEQAASAVVDQVDEVFVSEVGYVELHAALAAARRGVRLPAGDDDRHRLAADDLWEEVVEVGLDRWVLRQAVWLASARGLQALDAIHLASALLVRADEPLAFIAFDHRLREAAAAEGFVVLPEAT